MAELWINVVHVFQTIRLRDVIDIAVLAYLLYHGIRLVRETRAAQLVKGITLLLVLYGVAYWGQLRAMTVITGNVLQVGLLALAIVFQPELRRALEAVGRTKIGKMSFFSSGNSEQEAREHWKIFIDALAEEAASLSRNRIGALLVIERETRLGDIINTGTVIDSAPSPEMIGNIFFPNSPLHDGALVVRDGRLHAASCYLPLSENTQISRDLGTRHRAALGMSEVSDAIVIVISEETGLITVCRRGQLERGFSVNRLKELLVKELTPEPEVSEKKFDFLRGKKNEVES